ncbi:hypothetical protein [Neodiprion sertifer nucleopolyhedrovirus]|uniref:Uncharacterized protein n=1 Tax=Neodiprion sertifer nucleopolyhedrovirus TaxID=111874 RepID=Q6JKE7_9CBAC|nr:hypothetical protein NeseNPV_gp13 [Neodiprion sertifer nucleopolyhedrovirus]AAQ96390.1 hypothetical protein [Neodiprion sertifer nucleopolyhedrovirus]
MSDDAKARLEEIKNAVKKFINSCVCLNTLMIVCPVLSKMLNTHDDNMKISRLRYLENKLLSEAQLPHYLADRKEYFRKIVRTLDAITDACMNLDARDIVYDCSIWGADLIKQFADFFAWSIENSEYLDMNYVNAHVMLELTHCASD